MKKIIALMVIIILAYGGYYWYLGNSLGELKYEIQKVSISGDKYKIDGEIPVVTDGIPKVAKQQINTTLNRFVSDSVDKTKKDFEDLAKDLTELRSETSLTYLGKVSVKNDFKKLPFINVAIETYYYSGGAHGINDVATFVFDAYTGKKLELGDIFEGDYLKLLSKLSLEALKFKDPKLETYSFAEDGTQPLEDNFKAFTLEPDGMHIVFGDYQVGPYSSGRPEIVIPYIKLDSVLKTEIKKIVERNK